MRHYVIMDEENVPTLEIVAVNIDQRDLNSGGASTTSQQTMHSLRNTRKKLQRRASWS